MAKPMPVQITISEIMGTGRCSQGFKVGDSWLIKKNLTPTNFCMSAFNGIYPAIRTLRYGGETPFGEKDVTYITCPDPKHVVVFELRRIRPDSDTAP
jgi:uncharacterized repeat protein (TIGR04076 family)